MMVSELVHELSAHMRMFFFQAEDGIRDADVTGVQTCALPISGRPPSAAPASPAREDMARGPGHPGGGGRAAPPAAPRQAAAAARPDPLASNARPARPAPVRVPARPPR